MSTTKICRQCGWEVPYDTKRVNCRVCGAKYTERACRVCGKLFAIEEMYGATCRECRKLTSNNSNKQKRVSAKQIAESTAIRALKIWLEDTTPLSTVPVGYSAADWQRSVSYFSGCAYCGSSQPTTRAYYVGYQSGGRYQPWNILPLCDDCAIKTQSIDNPWLLVNRGIVEARYFTRALGYLRTIVKEAMSELHRSSASNG
jgi:hypothetical protein